MTTMSDTYTPDEEQVREQYTREQPPQIGTVAEKHAEFIAAARAEWPRMAAALQRVADLHQQETGGTPAGDVADVCSCGTSYWPCPTLQAIEREAGLEASGATRAQADYYETAVAEFDRFIASMKAEAWDEGREAGQRAIILKEYTSDNPYRKDKNDDLG